MTATTRWGTIQPWLSLLVRLGMAGILIAAAVPKFADLSQSVRAVRAYRLLPEVVVPLVGNMLPVVELLLATLLILGIFTRLSSIVWLIMMAAFMFGVIWAWSTGLTIDCGCFGGGGEVGADETNYFGHLMERVGFVAMGTFLAIWPRSKFSLDSWISPTEYTDTDIDADTSIDPETHFDAEEK